MGLKDDLKRERVKKGPDCSIKILRQLMTPEDLADFDEALADITIAGTSISRVLTRRGMPVSADSIRRHRNRECLCGE